MSLEVLSLSGDARCFTLDLEWIGDITAVRTVRIFSIALVHIATGEEFSAVVDPGVPHSQLTEFPTFPGCRTVTRSFLRRNHALPFKVAFSKAVEFAKKHASKMPTTTALPNPIMICHGAFRGDMPALESALRKTSTPFPNWRFADSLYFFRRVLPEAEGYKLSDVAAAVGVLPESAGRAHDALPDARTLYTALKRGAWSHFYGAVYSMGMTPLLNVPGIGLQGQNQLFFFNIRSVEDLLNFSLRCRMATTEPQSAPNQQFAAHKWRIEQCLLHMGLKPQPASSIADFCMGCLKVFDEND